MSGLPRNIDVKLIVAFGVNKYTYVDAASLYDCLRRRYESIGVKNHPSPNN